MHEICFWMNAESMNENPSSLVEFKDQDEMTEIDRKRSGRRSS